MYSIENASSSEYRENDGELIESYIAAMAAGDAQAAEGLYLKTRAAVYGFSLSILKNKADAEDVLQETYVRIYRCCDTYRANGNPMPWVLTIAKNLCLMKLRGRRRTVGMTQELWESIPVCDFSPDADDRVSLRDAMLSLSEQERKIVTLHATSGMKHREIASLLGIPLMTVLSKYNRAIKKLQNMLDE